MYIEKPTDNTFSVLHDLIANAYAKNKDLVHSFSWFAKNKNKQEKVLKKAA